MIEYFPFGEAWVEERGSSEKLPYLFTGKELDEETGLYYYGARYYDPRTSVWQSPDPILGQYLKGNPNAGVFNSFNLALFTYTAQNSIKFIDPNGKWLSHSEKDGVHTITFTAVVYNNSGISDSTIRGRLTTFKNRLEKTAFSQIGGKYKGKVNIKVDIIFNSDKNGHIFYDVEDKQGNRRHNIVIKDKLNKYNSLGGINTIDKGKIGISSDLSAELQGDIMGHQVIHQGGVSHKKHTKDGLFRGFVDRKKGFGGDYNLPESIFTEFINNLDAPRPQNSNQGPSLSPFNMPLGKRQKPRANFFNESKRLKKESEINK